jgi:hypothetical protein
VIPYNFMGNPKLATDNGLAVVEITPSKNYIDCMFGDDILKVLNEMLLDICQKHDIPKDKIVIGGLSAGGVLGVRYTENHFENDKNANLKPLALFAIDPPLDYERFWSECERKVKLNFHEAAVREGKLIIDLLQKQFGGSPSQFQAKYHAFSPYSRNAVDGGRAKLLKNTPISIYHEPDVNWWIENRRQDYNGINSVDCAGLINDLKILGNKQATLIETQNKGYREDGSRHPHSWSIMDEKGLVDWVLGLMK